MRKQGLKNKIVSGMLTLALAVVWMPAVSVQAASEYTVTFRPGNVGQFGIVSDTDNTGKTAQEMAQEVADIYYAKYETAVTENGAIKVKVSAGADMPAIPGYIIPDSGYCVRSWGPEAGEKVTKNVDYVVDYGRLTDGVEYTVKYVDAESGESIAPFLTTYANIEDTIVVNAPATIATSDAGEYVLTSQATQEIVLGAEASDNVIVFEYVYSYDAGTVTEDVIVLVPGDTVVTTQTVTTYVDNGTTVVPGATVLENAEQDADNQDNQNAGNAEEAENNDDVEEAENQEEAPEEDNQDIVEIEDEDTPLASAPADEADEATEDFVEIEEEQPPLTDNVQMEESGLSTVAIIALGAGVTVMVLLVAAVLLKKKGQKEEQ